MFPIFMSPPNHPTTHPPTHPPTRTHTHRHTHTHTHARTVTMTNVVLMPIRAEWFQKVMVWPHGPLCGTEAWCRTWALRLNCARFVLEFFKSHKLNFQAWLGLDGQMGGNSCKYNSQGVCQSIIIALAMYLLHNQEGNDLRIQCSQLKEEEGGGEGGNKERNIQGRI